MNTLVSLVIGIAFCVVAWHPPVRDAGKPSTLANPNRLAWGKPRLLKDATGRIVQVLMAAVGVFVLIDAAVGLAT